MILTSCVPVAFASGAYDENGKYIYRTSTYDFELIKKDPQRMTDEEFFGVWDPASEEWIIESCFKYGHEDFPGLDPVEEAAKAGDYEAAKKALYAYYLPKQYEITAKKAAVETEDYFEINFRERNMYASSTNGQPLDLTDWVTQDWKDITVNSSIFSSYVTSMAKKSTALTLVIASMDKSNTPAEIKSRESDSPPVLNLTVNKVQRQFPAVEDSYISPGDNEDNNYGGEETLYAQEYGYVGHWSDKANPWTSEASPTKRTYLKFDVSDIKSTDEVTSASLTFNARTASGGDLTEKELLIYGWNDSSWDENSIKWSTFTDWFFFSCNDQETWNFVTSSSTKEKGKICYFHRGAKIQQIAEVFNNTKDERYGYTFLREFMSTVTHVGDRLDVMNALDTSNHVHNVGNCFIGSWDSKYMTPEIFTAGIKHFYMVTDAACEKWLVTGTAEANTATNLGRMTYSFAMKYPEIKKSDYWYEVTQKENMRIYKENILKDGTCVEQGMSYVQTFMGNISMAHSAVYKLVDNPYYGMYADQEGAEILRNILVNALFSTSWDYGEFDLGDSKGHTYKSWFTSWYRILLDFGIDDPYLKYVATDGREGKALDFTSNSFPAALRTYMRTGWSKNDVLLAFTNKGNGESHLHRDQLHIVLKAYGQDLLVDSYGANLINPTRSNEVSAKMHNTITVNDGTISNTTAGTDGVEKEQELNDLYNYTTYTTAFIDGAKNAERTVLFLKNQRFFIVSDFVKVKDTSKSNKLTQFWHMSPDANISLTENNEFRSNFESGANVIVSPVGADSMSGMYLQDSLHGASAGVYIETQKGVYERRTNDTAKYGTIIYPLQAGQDREITTDEIDVGIENNGASAFRIIIRDPKTLNLETYYYYHLSDLSQKKVVTIGDYETDATSILVQEDMNGKVISFFIYDGSYIKKFGIKDEYLLKSIAGDVTLGVNLASGSIAEFSTDDADFSEQTLEEITVYAGYSVKSATFNGGMSGANKSGAYLYFSSEPIIECTEDYVDSDSDGTTNDKVFGEFGGGGGGGGGGSVPPVDDDNKEETTDPVTPVDPVTPAPSTPSYDDVSKGDWYHDYVTELTEKKIVSGDGTGNFGPANNVTREQFLKMLILAADVETEEAENTFDDVSDDAWYKEFVLMAKGLGIVNGISDTKFGIGTNITRQDMAVMIGRIIEELDITVEVTETEAFADEDKASEYAKEALMLMKSIGLIEGYNNEYRPLDTLTRAESAKVISELLKLIETNE